MRPGQNKRMRGRPNTNNGGSNRKGPNPLTRSYESNGPDVKIRGNAHHVAEKYLQLARDAQSSGDPVAAESYLQHAEHYFRLIASAQQAQAGFTRQVDAVDTEGEDEDESGIPDRFASPQAPAPFVPQPQPYAAERPSYGEQRQPYNGDRQGQGQGGERQPYADRQGGERPAYADRQVNGERPQYGDRSEYRSPRQDRQERNGLSRRPYRDNAERNGEIRADDRAGQDRFNQDRPIQDRPAQDRPTQERSYGDRNGQDRQNRRNGQDRPYDRQDRGQGERFPREASAEPPRDPYSGEQPRIEPVERQPEPTAASVPEPAFRAETAPQLEPAPCPEPAPRPAPGPAPRAAPPEDAPGLPSFITTPTRAVAVESAPPAEPSLATTTAFPGDGAAEPTKFPRRRRRTTRAASAEPGDQPALGDQPAVSGD